LDHLRYIAAAYGIAFAMIVWLSVDAALRARRAKRRLAAIDRRAPR
jgi:heme exporter protein CcmD